MAKETMYGPMAEDTLEIMCKIKEKAKGHIIGVIIEFFKVNGKLAKEMEREN
jgi:hypothetical protein